jgi:hypothetical protein
MFSGHDWRTAIGPRSGYYERCRHCYVTRPVEDDFEVDIAPAPAEAPQAADKAKSSERAA